MIIKLKRREMLFYLSYVIVYISLFIGDVYNGGSLDTFARYLRICSYVLIFTSCINLKLKKKEIFQMIAVLMVTLLYAVKTGDLYWSILILLIYNSKRAKIENIYKMSLRIIVLGIISVLVLCVVGVLPDVLTSRNTVEQINYNRHSLGFYHSNVLPLLIFYLLKPEQLTKKLTLVKTYNYGAATVINKSAKNLVCRLWPEVDDLPHDMWIGTLCYWFGKVYYVDEELYYWIRYETSVTGEGTKETAIRYRLKKTVQKKSYPNISTAILDGYGDLLRPEDRDFLKRINDYSGAIILRNRD